jgi:zinc protease
LRRHRHKPHAVIANGLIGSIDRDTVYTSDATDLALVKEFVTGLTPDQVNAALKAAFVGNGPLLFLSSTNRLKGAKPLSRRSSSALSGPHRYQAAAGTGRLAVHEFWHRRKGRRNAPCRRSRRHFIRFENGVR